MEPSAVASNDVAVIESVSLRPVAIMTEQSDIETDRHIGAEGTEPAGEPRRSGAARQRDLDEQLDAALACTFPASDPVGRLVPDLGGRNR